MHKKEVRMFDMSYYLYMKFLAIQLRAVNDKQEKTWRRKVFFYDYDKQMLK